MMTFPTEWKNKKIMFQTTNQLDFSIVFCPLDLWIHGWWGFP